jgi:hypothetical protein
VSWQDTHELIEMDHSYIVENQVAERYLLGKLPPEEASRFEEHSLACAECLDHLETAETLRLGLRHVAVERAAEVAVGMGLLARLVRSRYAPWVLSLLLLIAVVPSGLLYRRASRLDGELRRTREAQARESAKPPEEVAALQGRLAEQQRQAEVERRERERLAAELERAHQPLVNLPVVSLSPVRSAPGAEPAVRVVLSPETEWVVFSLQLEEVETAKVRAALLGPDGQVRWQSADLRPDAQGILSIALPASQLAPGDFAIRVETLSPRGPGSAVNFPFRVSRNARK